MPANTQGEQPGTLAIRDDGRYVLSFERNLRHPPERVWSALTEPEELREWFPADIEGDRRVGARLRFVFRDDAPKAEDMHEVLEHDPKDLEGEVTEIDPPRLLAYTWGDEELRWELEPTGGGCRLAFSHTFDERSGIPHPGGPRKRAARDASGWEICFASLEAVLDGRNGAPEEPWEQLYESYLERFGNYA